jgi:hypothetical protein
VTGDPALTDIVDGTELTPRVARVAVADVTTRMWLLRAHTSVAPDGGTGSEKRRTPERSGV